MLRCEHPSYLKHNARALRTVPWYDETRVRGNQVLGGHSVWTWTRCMVSPKSCLLSFSTKISQLCVVLHQLEDEHSCPSSHPHFKNLSKSMPVFNLLDAILKYFVALPTAKSTAPIEEQQRKNQNTLFPALIYFAFTMLL